MATKPFTFRNWGLNLRCVPQQYLQPTSEAEVCEIVNYARERHLHVRVVGGGHSWSPLVLTNDILLNLDYLDQLGAVDEARMQVTVGAGIRLKELNELLPQYRLALANLGLDCGTVHRGRSGNGHPWHGYRHWQSGDANCGDASGDRRR